MRKETEMERDRERERKKQKKEKKREKKNKAKFEGKQIAVHNKRLQKQLKNTMQASFVLLMAVIKLG